VDNIVDDGPAPSPKQRLIKGFGCYAAFFGTAADLWDHLSFLPFRRLDRDDLLTD
jgi:hypothetical protein